MQTEPTEFLPLAAQGIDYPAPRLALLPHLETAGWSLDGVGRVASLFLDRSAYFPFSRHALAEALKRCGAGPGRAVLLPAFHCRSLVEPALFLSAEARFYPMTPELAPDYAALVDLAADGRVAAMVLTHYFGFANDPERARAFCAERGIPLVEDCAHAFYGEVDGRPLGSWGRFAVASAWKFLPMRDGALLRENPPGEAPRLRQPSLTAELKALHAVLENARARRGRSVLPAPGAAEWVARARQLAARGGLPEAAGRSRPVFHPEKVGMAGHRVSRAILSLTDHARVAGRRRAHFQRWLDGLAGVAGIRPLRGELPAGVVPYAFPLLTDAGGLAFHALRSAGIPIWRWEDMARSPCPVAADYRLRLLQLPCHQSLNEEDVDWMIAVTRAVMPQIAP